MRATQDSKNDCRPFQTRARMWLSGQRVVREEGGEQQAAIALAEFIALRSEIEWRSTVQQAILALHLSGTGVTASIALNDVGRVAVLLILPMTGYIFCHLYLDHAIAIRAIGRYIKGDLSGRLGGQLAWEDWRAQDDEVQRLRYLWARPLYLLFPAVSSVSLAIAAVDLVLTERSIAARAALAAVWIVAVIATLTTLRLMRHLVGRGRLSEKKAAS